MVGNCEKKLFFFNIIKTFILKINVITNLLEEFYKEFYRKAQIFDAIKNINPLVSVAK